MMPHYSASELLTLRDLAGVQDECRDCGNRSTDEGFKIVPALLEAAGCVGRRTKEFGRFELIICKHCGTVTLVDSGVFPVEAAQTPALISLPKD
jgi:hypothetical protein